MAATRKRQDPAALDSISVAFVTFEHEESKRRCLEDYRYSRRGFCRCVRCLQPRFFSGRAVSSRCSFVLELDALCQVHLAGRCV